MISNQEIIETKKELEKKIAILQAANDKMPSGTLRVSGQHGHQYYYQYDNNDSKHPYGKYISIKNMCQIKQLAQKTYNQDLLDIYKKQLELISKFNEEIDFNADIKAFLNLSNCRRQMVEPFVLSDEMFVSKWYEEKMQLIGNKPNDYPNNYFIMTEHGEIVRSKSEKIIADKLFYKKIPYVYECPLLLQDGSVVYPDFTLLNIKKREEVYFEHFGLMDNPDYSRNAIEKIYRYEQNGYLLGKNLLVDFETKNFSVDTNHINIILDSIIG